MWEKILVGLKGLLNKELEEGGLSALTSGSHRRIKYYITRMKQGDVLKNLSKTWSKRIHSNKYLTNFLKNWKTSPNTKVFTDMVDNKLPTMRTFRTLMDMTGSKSPKQLLDMLEGDQGDVVIKKIKNASLSKQENLLTAIESDINEAALSSSWLAYGTFIPKVIGSDSGNMRLTTKDGESFETQLVKKEIWNKMRKQIGITRYKNGKRYGSGYGAGTILWKYVPRKTWKKVAFE